MRRARLRSLRADMIFLAVLALILAAYTARDAGRNERRLTAGDYSVSFSSNGAVASIEKKSAGPGEKGKTAWLLKSGSQPGRQTGQQPSRGGEDIAGEILLGDKSFPLTAPSATEKLPDGLRFVYDLPTTPRLRVELLYRLTLTEKSACIAREITLIAQPSSAAPSVSLSQAKFEADLTVRLPLAPIRLTPETWLPLKDGTGKPLTVSADHRAAYRFAGALRSSGVPLAIPIVSLEAGALTSDKLTSAKAAAIPLAVPPATAASAPAPSAPPASASTRITVLTDPYFSTLFSEDAVEWTYPKAVGLENGRETRSLSAVFHSGTPDDALAEFFARALPDVPPGPAWLHDIAMVDYDYLSDGGRGWFKDIDALAAALPAADRSKVLLCLHGWYDFVGRYSFDRASKTLDRAWTAFSNYPNVKKDFPNSVPVALTLERMHERLAYARSRGFRVGLYFADGMNAGEDLPEIYAPERVLYRGGWQGPDTKGKTFCQNPLRPEVYGFFLDYTKALLGEYGGELDALVWDETFHVPEGSLGTDACPGYADRAMMRLVRDITAEVRAYSRRSGRELAFMASDCIGVFNWVTKPPYALVADGTYQDTHCAPEAWSYGIFPNLRNVLWSCNWEPVTHFDYTEFGARAYQTPVAISNGWGDDIGFAEMSPAMRRKALDLFEWRKRFPARLRWLEALPVYEGKPNLKSVADASGAQMPFLSWDTEGGDKVDTNLLRPESAVRVQFLDGGAWKDAKMTSRRVENGGEAVVYELEAGKARVEWRIETGPGAGEGSAPNSGQHDSYSALKFTFSSSALAISSARLIFPFDPKATSTTVLPADWRDDGTFRLPAVLNAPDFGPMILAESSGRALAGRLEGSRAAKIVDLTLDLPEIAPGKPVSLTLSPLLLPPPPGLQATDLWPSARRGWLNALQPCSRWGEQDKPFSSPPGILGNNVISDPASISVWFYADQAFFTPEIAPGISLMPLVRRTIDYWLDQRMRRDAAGRLTGEITGYWDYGNFLDAEASPLIAAWDYAESTGDLAWLGRRIERLELAADFLARRDVDGDGFVEATQSGDRGTLVQPNRSCAWWDALNCGHKDGYTNALIYRAWRSLADLERKLGRTEKAAEYTQLADRLKAVYAKTLYNPKTGWLAWWKSRDGELHDYASPTLNGLAIEYGLVEPGRARQILDRLWEKMAEAGFTRFDLGVPPMLIPVHRSDYLQPDGIGIPKREDGTDTFGWYMNGGITAGQVLHFLAAHYVLGENERADRVLRAMLERQRRGEFQNGVRDAGGQGIDWTSWDGKPTGYEGYLADSFRFLQAVLLREESFRTRLYRPLRGDGPPQSNITPDPISGPKNASPQAIVSHRAPDARLRADIAFLEDAAKKTLEGCVMKASDGTLLYTPDGKANYAALWTRDFAYMVENAGDLMAPDNIEKCIEYLIRGCRGDGAVPDHVQADGLPVYAAGAPDNLLGETGIDNAQFLVFAVTSYLEMIAPERRAPLYAKWSPHLIKGMNCIPLAADGLVWNDPVKAHSPYGFTDTVGKTGELFMESLLYWRACKMLARWEGLYGSGKTRGRLTARARAIEKDIGSLWDSKTGMFFAASKDCRQTDIWGNAFAMYIDFPLAGKRGRIVDWLVSNYDRYVWHGQVRHLPKGEYWERQLMSVEKESYQNGGFWATPAGWVMSVLNGRDPALARRMFNDLIEDFRAGGICECVNAGTRKLESYVASATNPLGAARKIF